MIRLNIIKIKLLLNVLYIKKKKNVIYINKLKSAIKILLNNIFIIFMIFKNNIIRNKILLYIL